MLAVRPPVCRFPRSAVDFILQKAARLPWAVFYSKFLLTSHTDEDILIVADKATIMSIAVKKKGSELVPPIPSPVKDDLAAFDPVQQVACQQAAQHRNQNRFDYVHHSFTSFLLSRWRNVFRLDEHGTIIPHNLLGNNCFSDKAIGGDFAEKTCNSCQNMVK